jgi:hypothetical protein
MSFPRLLAAGKSVVGVKDELSPYRLTDENLLPRFSAEKSGALAGAAPAGVSPAEGEPCEARSLAAVARRSLAGTPSAAVGKSADKPPSDLVLPCSSVLSRHAARPGLLSGLGRAATWLWGKVWRWPARATPARRPAGAGRRAKPLVQTELALDQVKVVRNDLSDAAGEAPRRRKPGRKGAAASGPGPSAASGSSWARVTARWLGSGRT